MSNPWRIALAVALVLLGIGGGMLALRLARAVGHRNRAAPLPGEPLLAGYAGAATSPQDDLRAMRRLLDACLGPVGEDSRRPVAGNAGLAAALRGDNPDRRAFLPPGHPAFGPDGRLVDRWGTPLLVHPLGARGIGLRSAGPDRVPFTADDLVDPR